MTRCHGRCYWSKYTSSQGRMMNTCTPLPSCCPAAAARRMRCRWWTCPTRSSASPYSSVSRTRCSARSLTPPYRCVRNTLHAFPYEPSEVFFMLRCVYPCSLHASHPSLLIPSIVAKALPTSTLEDAVRLAWSCAHASALIGFSAEALLEHVAARVLKEWHKVRLATVSRWVRGNLVYSRYCFFETSPHRADAPT